MLRFTKKQRCFLLILFILIFFMAGVPAFADANVEYNISGYDVNVRIETDGSLHITESIKYTSFGGYNNVMLLIDKQEGETVEVESVYMLKKDGYIECDKLSAGQWDPNVFSGTYSVIQEKQAVRVKVYGAFSKRYGSIVVKYKVNNAIKRYGDVAEYRRTLIPKNWESRVSNINIFINLPRYADISDIRPFLHGVLVGRKTVDSKRAVSFNVPDTVPGEYVETRVVFPANLVPNARVLDSGDYLEEILAEEEEYKESSKEELLEARENAAREAGRRAWAERMSQRARRMSIIFSLVVSLLGLYTLYRIQKELHQLKKAPFPLDMRNIDRLSPAEVRRVIANGRDRGRSLLGSLLHLASLGYFEVVVVKREASEGLFCFKPTPSGSIEGLAPAEQFLLDWSTANLNEAGLFDPSHLMDQTRKEESSIAVKTFCDLWEQKVLDDYTKKNVLATRLILYRDLGLVVGALLFVLGLIIPVALSVWAGYMLLPIGLTLFLYTLRIQKHTDYGIKQHRTWKEIKRRLLNRTIALDSLPSWMTEPLALLGYTIVLGAEKRLGLIETALHRESHPLWDALQDEKQDALFQIIRNTLSFMDRALSSVQDVY